MALLGPASGVAAQRPFLPPQLDLLQRPGAARTNLLDSAGAAGAAGAPGAATPPAKFDTIIGRALSAVESAQSNAAATTRSVLLGDNGRMHESMIAMQEASLSLSLMIEVRNKVVEGYQELMRMPV